MPRTTLVLVPLVLLSALAVAMVRPASDGLTQEELDAMSAAIQKQVEELRGVEFLRPVEAKMIDAEGFVAYAKKELARSLPEGTMSAMEVTAKMLGLVPVDMDFEESLFAVLEEQVGGFYDPRTDTFYLMEGFGGGLAKIILAHELTHALDDQLYDLGSSFEEREGNDDVLFAYKAVVEGSGTTLMNQWALDNMSELSAEDLSGDAISTEVLESMPAYLWKPLVAEYLRGAAFLHRSDSVLKGQMGGLPDLADIAKAFDDPPVSSEQILHPEKYWGEKRDTPLDVMLEIEPLPNKWELLHQNTFGEMGLAFCTSPLDRRGGFKGQLAMLGARYTNDAAEGWGGDRYVLLGRRDTRILHMITVWDDADEAEEFAEELGAFQDHLAEIGSELAAGGELDQAGVAITHTDGSDEVIVTIWFGVDTEEVATVTAAVGHWVDGR